MHHVNIYSLAKTGGYPRLSPKSYSPIFKPYICYNKSSSKIWLQMVVTEKGNTCLFIKLYGRNLIRKHPMRKKVGIAKCLKDTKHNNLYFAPKYGCLFLFGYYLFLKAHFFPYHCLISCLEFCPWKFLKENVDIDAKYLVLIIKSKSETKGKKKLKNEFPIFNFPLLIPAFSNIPLWPILRLLRV